MLAVQNIFGLGQDATAPSNVITDPRIVMPVIPDNVTVRCKFDPTLKNYQCSPVGLFEPPTVFLLAAGALALLGLGYAFGRVRFIPRAVDSLVEDPRIVRR